MKRGIIAVCISAFVLAAIGCGSVFALDFHNLKGPYDQSDTRDKYQRDAEDGVVLKGEKVFGAPRSDLITSEVPQEDHPAGEIEDKRNVGDGSEGAAQ
jgi:hypothetical protein